MWVRLFHILLAVWWMAWSCVIVPGHTRGAVGVDGTVARGADGRAVVFFWGSVPSCCESKSMPGGKAPATGSSGNCAICMMVANTGMSVDVPAVVEGLRELAFGYVGSVEQLGGGAFSGVYQGRGPPV